MRFDTKRFAFAAAAAWAVWYSICYLLVVVAPEQFQSVSSFAFHYDLSGVRSVSWGGFLGGLLLTSAWIGLVAATVGWFFNGIGGSSRRVVVQGTAAPR